MRRVSWTSLSFRVLMCLISRIGSPAQSGRGGYSFSMVRPTIIAIISLRVSSPTGLVSITCPSRMTVTTSQKPKISSSLCEM